MTKDALVIGSFAVAAVLAGLVTFRLYSLFCRAVDGRKYTLTPRTLFTKDHVVKAHYRAYLWRGLWQNGLILLGLIVVLFYVAG